MFTKTKVLVAAVIGAAAMVVGTSSASAAFTSLSVNDRASIQLDGGAVVVSGFVQCTFGDSIFVQTSVLQVKGQRIIDGFGSTASITCTGSLQMWSVVVPVAIGEAFKNGQASSQTFAQDTTDATFQQVDQNLKLGN